MKYSTHLEIKKADTRKQYSTNPEAKKAVARKQYSANTETRRQHLISSIVLIQRQTRQPFVSNNTYTDTKKSAAHEQYHTNP